MPLRKVSLNLFAIVPEEAEEEGARLLLDEFEEMDWDWGSAVQSVAVDAAHLTLSHWQEAYIQENPERYPVLYQLLQEEGKTPS